MFSSLAVLIIIFWVLWLIGKVIDNQRPPKPMPEPPRINKRKPRKKSWIDKMVDEIKDG